MFLESIYSQNMRDIIIDTEQNSNGMQPCKNDTLIDKRGGQHCISSNVPTFPVMMVSSSLNHKDRFENIVQFTLQLFMRRSPHARHSFGSRYNAEHVCSDDWQASHPLGGHRIMWKRVQIDKTHHC